MNDAFVAGQRAAEREAATSPSSPRAPVGGGGTLGAGDVGGGDDDGDGCGGDGGGGGESNGAAAAVECGQSTWREASGRVGGSGDAYQIGDATRSALRWVTGGVRGSGSS